MAESSRAVIVAALQKQLYAAGPRPPQPISSSCGSCVDIRGDEYHKQDRNPAEGEEEEEESGLFMTSVGLQCVYV